MGYKKYRFVGLSRDVWLPDDIRVDIQIITSTRFRSYQPYASQNKTTWHDTGNPNTNENGEWTWANNGRPGGEVGGYNFITGDKHIIQCAPLNEITWAAGTPDGNMVSWHTEQAFGGGINWNNSLYTTAALHGALCAAMGWNVDTSLVKHQYWYGKWCPGQILNKGIWPQVVRMVTDAANNSRAAASGAVISNPNIDTSLKKGDKARVTERLNFRQAWGVSGKLMGTLPVGTEVTIYDGPQYADGFVWYDLHGTFGSGWAAGEWLEKVAPPKPAPAPKPQEPLYAKPLAIPELDKYNNTDVNHIPAIVEFGGGQYQAFWVGDRVQCINPQKRLRNYDGTEKELVGPWLNKGDSFDVSWIVIKKGDPKYAPMMRTPWGTFVWAQNVKRIGDQIDG